MTGMLPEAVDPAALAAGGVRLAGRVALAAMARLAADHGVQRGAAAVELQFGIDADGVRYLQGLIEAEVALTCNRCLRRYRTAVRCTPCLAIVADAQAAERLPERYEPLLAGPGPLALAAIVEDELLLALPLVPVHAMGRCRAAAVAEPAPVRRPNPFAVLAGFRPRARGG